MTTVIRSNSPHDTARPVPTKPTTESSGLGTEFRIARAKRLIELRGQGTDASPVQDEAAGDRPPDSSAHVRLIPDLFVHASGGATGS